MRFVLLVLAFALPLDGKTILAIGAHAGDVELTSGAVLMKQKKLGDRIVILHMTLGEGGNPKMPTEQYAAQKRREALAAGAAIGAEVMFARYGDGELPDDNESRRFVAEIIRQVQPQVVITHWRESLHRDHAATNRIVRDAVLLASLEGVKTASPAWRGVRGVWYAENWEDAPEFSPYIYVDTTDVTTEWKAAVSQYEFVRGGISTFPYLDYYTALATVRGAQARKKQAEAFDIEPEGKRRVLDSVP
jgi:LmbE family N-acetylglucosaminyl deacetylase